jgi:hypothetical protein
MHFSPNDVSLDVWHWDESTIWLQKLTAP